MDGRAGSEAASRRSGPVALALAPLWARIMIGAGLALAIRAFAEELEAWPVPAALLYSLSHASLGALLCAWRDLLAGGAVRVYFLAWLGPWLVALIALGPFASGIALIGGLAGAGGVTAVRALRALPASPREEASREVRWFVAGAIGLPVLAAAATVPFLEVMVRIFDCKGYFSGDPSPDAALIGPYVALMMVVALLLALEVVAWLAREAERLLRRADGSEGPAP